MTHGFLRVATVVPGEAGEVRACGLLGDVDLLAVNLEEARALSGSAAQRRTPRTT